MSDQNLKKIMIIAAEASSAHYALKLIQYWKKQGKNYFFFGVGDKKMEAEGFVRIGKAEDMAVVGLTEVISNYSDIKKVFDNLIDRAEKEKPDAVILMDYAGFNLRLAKRLKDFNLKIFYYISPHVWAWRKNRIYDIKKYCLKTFLLFPFEKDFYDKHQVNSEFVGHPLLEELSPDLFDRDKLIIQRHKFGIKDSEKVLALMPGSRRGEVEKNFPIQIQVARKLLIKHPHLRLMIFTAPTLEKEDLQKYLENFKSPYILLKDDPFKMISLADYVLATSGTATLMVGLLEKPMVIMYKAQWLTGVVGSYLLRHLKFFGLVNLILNKEAVPERKQSLANESELFDLMEKYVTDSKYTASVITDLKKIKYLLGNTDLSKEAATSRVAKSIDKEVN